MIFSKIIVNNVYILFFYIYSNFDTPYKVIFRGKILYFVGIVSICNKFVSLKNKECEDDNYYFKNQFCNWKRRFSCVSHFALFSTSRYFLFLYKRDNEKSARFSKECACEKEKDRENVSTRER